jgi:hypothetical protein
MPKRRVALSGSEAVGWKLYAWPATTLVAGTSDKDDAARALPQLTGVFAFPTTIWVDRSGKVRKLHAGFSGPATLSRAFRARFGHPPGALRRAVAVE